MTDTGTPDGGGSQGSIGRGLILVLVGVGIGAAVLANVPKLGSQPTGSEVATTTTSAPSSPTTAGRSSSSTSTTLATHQAGSVKVLVANGTSTSGVASKLAAKLTSAGYDVLSPTNTTSPASASAVYYASGYQGDAVAIAQSVGMSSGAVQAMSGSGSGGSGSGSGSGTSGSGSTTSTSGSGSRSGGGSGAPVSDTKGAQVVVIIGPDLASSLSS